MDNERTSTVLNSLIETCYDGEYGFRTARDQTQSEELKAVFSEAAASCAASAAELASLVRQHGGHPEESGTTAGSLHRGWIAMRESVKSADDLVVLEECKRGEDVAVARYRKALSEPSLAGPVQAVIERQLAGARRRHDQIRDLHDRWAGITARR